jgi:hypothetical protein
MQGCLQLFSNPIWNDTFGEIIIIINVSPSFPRPWLPSPYNCVSRRQQILMVSADGHKDEDGGKDDGAGEKGDDIQLAYMIISSQHIMSLFLIKETKAQKG